MLANQPISQRQTDINCFVGLDRQLLVRSLDRLNQLWQSAERESVICHPIISRSNGSLTIQDLIIPGSLFVI